MHEQLLWAGDGRLRRVRTVLSTVVETFVDGEGHAVERVGGEGGTTRELPSDELVRLRDDLAAHPLRLLAEWIGADAAGRARWRLIATKDMPGGGEVHVVERRGDDGRTWTRIGFDTESHLVRLVETRRLDPATGVPIEQRDEWRDWRHVGPLRVPFHRSTFVGGPNNGRTTSWETFVIGEPDPDQLVIE